MIETSVAHPAPTAETDEQAARRERGQRLVHERLSEIKRIEGSLYTVPSSKPSEAYAGTIKPVVACSCPDFHHRGSKGEPCKHVYAVRYLLKKTGVCAGCGERHFHRDLTAVTDSLTYFDGDLLCRECFASSDASPL